MALDERRRGTLSEAAPDLNTQENKAANTVKKLLSISYRCSTPRCPVRAETSSVDKSIQPFSLHNYEVHQESLAQMRREVAYLRSISENVSLRTVQVCVWLNQDCVRELNAGVTTPLAEFNDLKKNLRITQLDLDQSESQIDRLTQLPLELQEVVNTHQDVQDFEDLETASSSVSIHVPGGQSDSPSFSSQHRRPSRNIFATQNEVPLAT